jgi:hypothetical protein
MQLSELWSEAKQRGWATGQAKVNVSLEAAMSHWTPVATREGDESISRLRPTDRGQAHPRSISAVHGLGEQPLHVDGAHMVRPPDVVVLTSENPSSTPTNLWRFGADSKAPFEAMCHGLFVVGSGRSAFLSPVLEETRRGRKLRYDPTIMIPADARAHEAAEYLNDAQAPAFAFQWTEPDSILVIDNRSVLHGRAALLEGDIDRELTRQAFYLPEEP